MDQATMRRMLTLHGIAMLTKRRDESERHVQTFQVLVYGLDVIAVYLRRVGALGQIERIEHKQTHHRALIRMMRLAVRAAYCLGLEMARITLRAHASHQGYAIVAIHPSPRLTQEEEVWLAEAIIQQNDRSQQWKQAVIGMDLECLLCREDGKIVSAAQFLERHGQAGYDGIRVRGKAVYPIVELRPLPGTAPKHIFQNLMKAMKSAAEQITDTKLSWLAGGMPKQGFCLGGHIHLSHIRLSTKLLKALDNYLALPLVMIEAESSRKRRPRYGFLGDFRHQFHGGFEYRTLPSWIVSPTVARGVIALVRIIVDHYEQLNKTPLNDEIYQSHFYMGATTHLRDIVHTIWSDLENTASYERYRHDISPLKHLIMKQERWQEAVDIRAAWHIHAEKRIDVMRSLD